MMSAYGVHSPVRTLSLSRLNSACVTPRRLGKSSTAMDASMAGFHRRAQQAAREAGQTRAYQLMITGR